MLKTLPKISCVCLTYNRHDFLKRALWCFLEQDYPKDKCELIILDDAGQYDNCVGDNWELVSINRRFSSVGSKRNASISLISTDSDVVAIWDDDDIYMPWTLRAHAAALESADLSRPSVVLDDTNMNGLWYKDKVKLTVPNKCDIFHGACAYRVDVFKAVGWYPDLSSGEDKDLLARMEYGRIKSAISTPDDIPYYVFNRNCGLYHISWASHEYHKLEKPNKYISSLVAEPYDVDYQGIISDLTTKEVFWPE